jgi:selenocysteine lyase/cysteine desulfurase
VATRRSFLTAVAGGIGGELVLSGLGWQARAATRDVPPGPGLTPDEEFWKFVRMQFPVGDDPCYMNNGTMGISPYAVADAVRADMEDADRKGRYGGWDDVRPEIARFINAAPEEIALTHNVTEGINVVASGLPLTRGDEVILTDHEHAGNAIPWLARSRRDGVVVKYFTPGRTAAETLERIAATITSRTRVIAVPHVTCTIGQVLPGAAISRLGHERGLWVMLDAAHTPGMLPLDVKALGCDFMPTCGHKWLLGPKGTGFLYVRKEALEVMEPHWVGGGCDAGWDVRKGTLAFRNDAHRFDFGTQNASIYAGLGAAIRFVERLGQENVTRRVRELSTRLRNGLMELGDKVEILTPDEVGGFGGVLGFRMKNVPYDKLQKMLMEEHHIITRMVPENGINCNRVSTHVYNTPAEVDRLLGILRSVA